MLSAIQGVRHEARRLTRKLTRAQRHTGTPKKAPASRRRPGRRVRPVEASPFRSTAAASELDASPFGHKATQATSDEISRCAPQCAAREQVSPFSVRLPRRGSIRRSRSGSASPDALAVVPVEVKNQPQNHVVAGHGMG